MANPQRLRAKAAEFRRAAQELPHDRAFVDECNALAAAYERLASQAEFNERYLDLVGGQGR